jgi:formate dehydrogenase subunit delta
MDVSRLVAMANDIAAFFQGEAGEAGASAKVAEHLKRFWAPRMRQQLVAYASAGGAGLSAVAQGAVRLLVV